MPSSFTDATVNGEPQTLAQFILAAASEISWFAKDLNGGPLPDEFTPSERTKDALDATEAALLAALQLGDEAWEAKATEQYQDELRTFTTLQDEARAKLGRIKTRIAEVETWTPPTPVHEPLKRLALEKLHKVLEKDHTLSAAKAARRPMRSTGSQLKEVTLTNLKYEVTARKRQRTGDLKAATDKTLWVRRLRDNLNQPALSTS